MTRRRARQMLTRIRPADLRRLRAGQTVSMFGDEVTGVALPTVAILLLHATPFQFGLIGASSYLPYPVLGLLVGAWVDRVRRRSVLLLADAARFAAIASIPVAAITGHLTLGHLFAVGLTVGTASVFFNSAYQAYLPSIVNPDGITSANARLSVSETSAQVAGPTLAGLLINFLGAAGALLLDAGSFLASIVSLLLIRKREPRPRRERRSLVPDVREGLRVVFGNPLLRGLTLTSALSNLGRGMALELFLLFAYSGLQMSPALAGAVLAAGNVGSLLGALTCNRVTARVGIGPMLLIGSIMKGLPWVFIPLGLLGGAVPISIAVMILSGYFIPISNVTTLSIRQSLVGRQLQGRVAATTRTVTRTVLPLSAVLGGGLAQIGTGLLGPRAGLAWVLAFGGLLWTSATFLIPRRALRHVRSISDLNPDAAGRADPGPDATAPAEAAPGTGTSSAEPWVIPSAARWTADPGLYDSPGPVHSTTIGAVAQRSKLGQSVDHVRPGVP